MTHEEIAKEFEEKQENGEFGNPYLIADRILSYFQSAYTPLIEEARREEREKLLGLVVRNSTGYVERDGVKYWQLDLDALESDLTNPKSQ